MFVRGELNCKMNPGTKGLRLTTLQLIFSHKCFMWRLPIIQIPGIERGSMEVPVFNTHLN